MSGGAVLRTRMEEGQDTDVVAEQIGKELVREINPVALPRSWPTTTLGKRPS